MIQTNGSNTGSSSKVFNLFTNFLSRTKSNNDEHSINIAMSQQQISNNPTSATSNYLNLKNLKRASSTSQFSSNINKHSTDASGKSRETQDSSSSPTNRSLSKFSPSNLFTSKSKSGILNKEGGVESAKPLSVKTENSKYRRSFDDVSSLSISRFSTNNDTSIINKFDANTALSTKNNGLIFLPNSGDDLTGEIESTVEGDREHESMGNYENLGLGTAAILREPLRSSSSFCATNLHLIQE